MFSYSYTVNCSVSNHPSSESRHNFVANYTSAVIFEKDILVLFCCIIIPLYVCESKYLNVICLVKTITISSHDPINEGIFSHVSVTVLQTIYDNNVR